MSPTRQRWKVQLQPSPAWPALQLSHETAEILEKDGWRLAAFRQPDRVVLQSRSGRDLGRYLPDIAAAVERLELGTVLDGEVLIWRGERTDFAALQRRITAGIDPAAPANYVAFDLLQHLTRGVTLQLPLSTRRELLTEVLDDAPLAIAVCPKQTTSWSRTTGWPIGCRSKGS